MVRLRIKELAQQQGIRQNALAHKSGVTDQLLNRYWNNNVLRVDLKELDKIATALGVAPGELLGPDADVSHE